MENSLAIVTLYMASLYHYDDSETNYNTVYLLRKTVNVSESTHMNFEVKTKANKALLRLL